MTTELSPMQKELLERADSIFGSIGATVSKAGAYAAEQIPDIAMQYVTFGRAYSTALILIFLLLVALGLYFLIFLMYKNISKLRDDYGDPHGGRVLFGLFGGIAVACGISGIAVNMQNFLLVWFAPKIWLIQSMVKLVKGIV